MNFNRWIRLGACLGLAVFSPLHGKGSIPFALQDGDIVFSGSRLGQGAAIIAATGSPFTHCGVVFKQDGRWMVIEAVQPVSVATLEDFMARGRKEVFTALRLKTAISPDAYRKAREWAAAQIGRDYDVRFGWDDKTLLFRTRLENLSAGWDRAVSAAPVPRLRPAAAGGEEDGRATLRRHGPTADG